MENSKEQYTNKKRRQRIEIEMVNVLYCMVVTLDTAHFERSLLNADAAENAVQIIKNNNTTTEKKRQRTNTERKKKIGNNILVGYSLLDTKMENYKEQYTKKMETKN